jgi:hypothetical protein
VIRLSEETRGELDRLITEFFKVDPEGLSDAAKKIPDSHAFFKDGTETVHDHMITTVLKHPSLKAIGESPRFEERKAGSDVIQVAIAFKNSAQRDRFFAFLERNEFSGIETRKAGRTTFEAGTEGVSKSLPFHFLASSENFSTTLDQMGYTPSPLFDARTHRTAIVADADGTIWETPRASEPPEGRHLGNSDAKDSILKYLRKGGVLIINSGNDPERVVTKVLAGIPADERSSLLSRILVSASGGSILLSINPDGTYKEIEGYRQSALSCKQMPLDSLDVVYLGDDHKKDGNDWDAFEAVGFDRSICVPAEKLESPIPIELKKNMVRGKENATKFVMESITKRLVSGKKVFTPTSIAHIAAEASVRKQGIQLDLRAQIELRVKKMAAIIPEAFRGVDTEKPITLMNGKLLEAFERITHKKAHDSPEVFLKQVISTALTNPDVAKILLEIEKEIVAETAKPPGATLSDWSSRLRKGADVELEARRSPSTVSGGIVESTSSGAIDLVRKIEERIGSLDEVKFDAKVIADAFQQPVRFTKSIDGKFEITPTSKLAAITSDIDGVLINGNNDLLQVEHTAHLYRSLTKREGAPPPLVTISGFGGHGTSPGSIFSYTEAETMGAYFDIIAKPEGPVILETEARDSGQNVSLSIQKWRSMGAEPKHLLISGTPSAVWRQAAGFMAQCKDYPWDSITICPPTKDDPEMDKYFLSDTDGMISMMCSLREVASFLDYQTRTNFLAPVIPDRAKFERSIETFVKYYEKLTQNPSPIGDGRAFCEKFLAAIEKKSAGDLSAKAELLQLSALVEPMASFFRTSFSAIESVHMKVSSQKSLSGLISDLSKEQSHTYRAL